MGDVGRERRPFANGRDAIKTIVALGAKATSCVWCDRVVMIMIDDRDSYF